MSNKARCRKAIKLLKEYERLMEAAGHPLDPKRIAELDRKRDDGTITSNDRPGTLQREFPGEFKGKTLDDIRRECGM